jgi:hypothetical protein
MKYTREIIENLCNYLKETGNAGRVEACKGAGISYFTFKNWLDDPRKIEFSKSIKKAEAQSREGLRGKAISCIATAMENQWQAAAWWLERNYKDEFGKDAEPPKEKEQDTTEVIFEFNSHEPIENKIEKSDKN